jgi:hypothetical protein
MPEICEIVENMLIKSRDQRITLEMAHDDLSSLLS